MIKLAKCRYLILKVLIIFLIFAQWGCDQGATSEVYFNGRKLIVKGGTSHSTSQNGNILRVVVDNHNIIVEEERLTLNGIASQLPDYEEILLTIDGGFVHIELDGKAFLAEESGKFKLSTGHVENVSASNGLAVQKVKRLPKGFVRVQGLDGSGQVLYLKTRNISSATLQLTESLAKLSSYFDDKLTTFEGFRDDKDVQAQTTFFGRFSGSTIAGVAFSAIDNNIGVVGLVFDQNETLPQNIDRLIASLENVLGVSERKQRVRQKINWHTAYFPDGSGTIKLPQGWKITSSYQGGVNVAGTEGENMALGIGLPIATPEAATNPYTGTQMSGTFSSYPMDPVDAVQRLVPQLAQYNAQFNPQAPHISDIRVIEATQAQSPTNGQAAFILYDVRVNQAPYRVLSFIDCSPAFSGYWTFYYSTVAAPVNQFEEKLSLMVQAWSGWKVNPQVFQQRLNRALNSMKQTHRLLREANEYRQRTFDNTLADWSEVFRGTRIVRDTQTGIDSFTDIGWVNQTVQQLNEQAGYQRFEQIPLREFNTR